MLIFQVAVGLAAFLVFLVQPLAAKQILPWFGGGPLVWSASLLFFQLALVAGYGYAHLTRRLGIASQVPWHIVLLLVALATLPITAPAALEPTDGSSPVGRVLIVLAATVGLPFVLLSATAPLLQDWFAQTIPGRTPYRLYVVSNIGSLAALLVYPLAVERWLDMPQQVTLWSVAFVAAVVACAGCGWIARRQAAVVPAVPGTTEPARLAGTTPRIDRALWFLLPACSSGLLLATTSQLTQDVAAVPLLWVVPLAVYLLTYILAFAGWYSRPLTGAVFVAAGIAALVALWGNMTVSWMLQGLVLLAVFGGACMICHGELVRIQPPASRLTAFYLALAAGGSLGGLFVALGAPHLFDRYVELPLLFLAAGAVLAGVIVRDYRGALRGDVATLLSAAVTTTFVVAGLVIALGSDPPGLVARARSPYGVMRIVDEPEGTAGRLRRLYHGRILHGTQFLDPARAMEPTSYYGTGSGVSMAIREHPRRETSGLTIGAVGLGTGSVASLTRSGDHLTFFELDPLVVQLARRYFGFLAGARSEIDVITGDARLSIERQLRDPGREGSYDVIVVDAFSGDSIPVHLLTLEGFETYRRALRADGILAVHISNRYLDLEPIVQGAAQAIGFEVVPILKRPDARTRATGSQWLLVTRNEAFLQLVRPRAGRESEPRAPFLWTDAFSSLVSALR